MPFNGHREPVCVSARSSNAFPEVHFIPGLKAAHGRGFAWGKGSRELIRTHVTEAPERSASGRKYNGASDPPRATSASPPKASIRRVATTGPELKKYVRIYVSV